MGKELSFSEKVNKEFKLGATIKIVTEKEGVNTNYVGKYVGVNESQGVITLIGFQVGVFTPGVMNINYKYTNLGQIISIKRSRLMGKTGEYISKMYDSYIKYINKQRKIAEQRERERKELGELQRTYYEVEDKYSKDVYDENKDNISEGVKVYNRLKELRGKDVGGLSITNSGDTVTVLFTLRLTPEELVYINTYLEYDNTLHLHNPSRADIVNEFSRYYSVLDKNGKINGGLGKVETNFDVQPSDFRIYLDVEHKFIFNENKIKESEEVDSVARNIYSSCIQPLIDSKLIW